MIYDILYLIKIFVILFLFKSDFNLKEALIKHQMRGKGGSKKGKSTSYMDGPLSNIPKYILLGIL